MDKQECIREVALLSDYLIVILLSASWLIRWMKSAEIREAMIKRERLLAIIENFEELEFAGSADSGR